MAGNANLKFRNDDRTPRCLGGMLISTPNTRAGFQDTDEKWVNTTGKTDLAMDHMEWFYDANARRWVLASLPNITLNEHGQCDCGCVNNLTVKVGEINERHTRTVPGKKKPESLTVHIGQNGTSWREPNRPLIIIASNIVKIILDTVAIKPRDQTNQ